MNMDIENTASQHTQYAERHGRGLRTSKEGDRQASQTGEYAGRGKKDSVEISDDGRRAAMQIKLLEGDFLAQFKESGGLLQIDKNFVPPKWEEEHRQFEDICNTLNSLRDDYLLDDNTTTIGNREMRDVAAYLFNALNGKVGNSYKDALEVSVQLAKMICNPYKIGDIAGKSYLEGNEESRAADREAGRNMAEYIAKNYFDDPKEAQDFMDKINKCIKNYELQEQGWTIRGPFGEPFDVNQSEKEVEEGIKRWAEKQDKERRDIIVGYSERRMELFALRDEQAKIAKEIIQNAKLITDFSGNEKWNNLMNLLSKAM
jgi:hypothetical protein